MKLKKSFFSKPTIFKCYSVDAVYFHSGTFKHCSIKYKILTNNVECGNHRFKRSILKCFNPAEISLH